MPAKQSIDDLPELPEAPATLTLLKANLFYCLTYSALIIGFGAFMTGPLGESFTEMNVIACMLLMGAAYRPTLGWNFSTILSTVTVVLISFSFDSVQQALVGLRPAPADLDSIYGVYVAAISYGLAELVAYVTRLAIWREFSIFNYHEEFKKAY